MFKKTRYLKFSVTAIMLAYTITISAQIDTSGVNKLFSMDLLDLMNQKVVSASKYSQNSADAPSSIGVISAAEIKQYAYKTLGEALNSQRGMYLSDDKNYLYTGSRGFSRPTDYNNRIIVMIDGHIMNEVVYGSSFMGNELGINLDNVERIEIIRGPGSSLYGSGSMLNTINLIMKKGAASNGITVSAGAGSFGTENLSAIYGKKFKNTDISISGTGGTSNGENYYFSELNFPEKNFGKSLGMDWEKFTGFQASITNGDFKISSSFTDRSKGIPTGAFNTDLTGNVESSDRRFYLESSFTKKLHNNNYLLFRLYYDDYLYNGSYPTAGFGYFDASQGKWSGGEVQYYLEAGKRNIITAGFEYKYAFRNTYHEWDNDTTFFRKNYPFSFYSIYGQDQLKITEKLNLTGGLRFDQYSVFGHSTSPRLALVYRYSAGSSIKLLYSAAFRIPNLYEAYYESYNNHKSNPDIMPERIRTTEIAWLHKISGSFSGSMSVYRFAIFNLIDQILDTDGLSQFRNIGRATGTGAEYEVKYKNPRNASQAFLNLTLQHTIDNETGELLSNSPAFMIRSGFVFGFTRYLSIVSEFFYESRRKTLTSNKTGDIYLFNLGINSNKIFNHFELSLKTRNLFNIKYYTPGGNEHVQDEIVQNSRNIYIKLTAHF